jgi:PAS domain-containing protein
MKKPKRMRGLSDMELTALLESLPEGLALVDDTGELAWANRLARRQLALRATTGCGDRAGAALAVLVERLVAEMPPWRDEQDARWTVMDGAEIEVSLRRLWASHVAVRLTAPVELSRAPYVDSDPTAPSPWQLIVAERMLEQSAFGLVVANPNGGIDWMNAQAHRLLGGATPRMGRDARRRVTRAARHVAGGRLTGPIRMHLDLATRVVDALFWSVAPGMAGVLFDDDVEPMKTAFWRERLIA